MLTDAPSQTYHSNARPVDDLSYMNVPVIHIKAQCGYLAGYGDTEYIDTLPTMPVIVDKTYHGKYRIFEAEGDSMDDNSRLAICDGDKVLAREVRRDLWLPNFISTTGTSLLYTERKEYPSSKSRPKMIKVISPATRSMSYLTTIRLTLTMWWRYTM